MKRIIALVMILLIAVECVGCSQFKRFSIEELKATLLSESVEFASFDVNEVDGGFCFKADADKIILKGTADKDNKVTYMMFINTGVDTVVFSNRDRFESWQSEAQKGVTENTTLGDLAKTVSAYDCISELEAFYALTTKGEDAFLFAVNALLNKESSEIAGWTVKVSVDARSDMLITEMVRKDATVSADPFLEAQEAIRERKYHEAVAMLSRDPENAYTFFAENENYKDCAEYLKRFKRVCVLEKTNTCNTTFIYDDGLLIREDTKYLNDISSKYVKRYIYTSDNVLKTTITKFESNTFSSETQTEYDKFGYPILKTVKNSGVDNLKTVYENTYYASGKIKTCRETYQQIDSLGVWQDVYIKNTVYEENGNNESTYEKSMTGELSSTVKCDEYGNVIYKEYQYVEKSIIYQYEYEYDSNGNILFQRDVGKLSYIGYEYNDDGTIAYKYFFDGKVKSYSSEVWYEYAYIYQG